MEEADVSICVAVRSFNVRLTFVNVRRSHVERSLITCRFLRVAEEDETARRLPLHRVVERAGARVRVRACAGVQACICVRRYAGLQAATPYPQPRGLAAPKSDLSPHPQKKISKKIFKKFSKIPIDKTTKTCIVLSVLQERC